MLVAIPLGLMGAIFLTQYAPHALRALLKPILRFWQASRPGLRLFRRADRSPAGARLRIAIGISSASSDSALAAGLVMGIMIIPFCQLDADEQHCCRATGDARRHLALGATRSETIQKCLLPAALPCVVGGGLAGGQPRHRRNHDRGDCRRPRRQHDHPHSKAFTTVTTQIVQLLTGDQEFDSANTLAAFALGLLLFLITLVLNLIALIVVRTISGSL